MRSLIRGSRWFRALLVALAALVLWTLASSIGLLPAWLLPPPHEIVMMLWSGRIALPQMLGMILRLTIPGLLIGGVSGVGVGFLTGYRRGIRKLLGFSLNALRVVPVLSLLSVLVWSPLGATVTPVTLVIALGVFPVLAIRTSDAVQTAAKMSGGQSAAGEGSGVRSRPTVTLRMLVPSVVAAIRNAVAVALGLGMALELLAWGPLVHAVPRRASG